MSSIRTKLSVVDELVYQEFILTQHHPDKSTVYTVHSTILTTLLNGRCFRPRQKFTQNQYLTPGCLCEGLLLKTQTTLCPHILPHVPYFLLVIINIRLLKRKIVTRLRSLTPQKGAKPYIYNLGLKNLKVFRTSSPYQGSH